MQRDGCIHRNVYVCQGSAIEVEQKIVFLGSILAGRMQRCGTTCWKSDVTAVLVQEARILKNSEDVQKLLIFLLNVNVSGKSRRICDVRQD